MVGPLRVHAVRNAWRASVASVRLAVRDSLPQANPSLFASGPSLALVAVVGMAVLLLGSGLVFVRFLERWL